MDDLFLAADFKIINLIIIILFFSNLISLNLSPPHLVCSEFGCQSDMKGCLYDQPLQFTMYYELYYIIENIFTNQLEGQKYP